MSSKAGYSGPKVKSDILIEFSGNGDTLSLNGFSPEQEKAIMHTAERLEISKGTATGEDCGAVPWVAAARFEAAVRKELDDMFLPLPPATEWTVQPKDRPRRSRLYAPGNKPRFIEKAAAAGADGIILDLEDSVAPDRKDEARILVAYALANTDFGDTEVMVRINQGERATDDLSWIVPQPVQHILLPKVEKAEEVAVLRDMVETVMDLCGRDSFPWLMPIIESPRGILNALSIADSVPEMAALTLGLQDLTAEIGIMPTPEATESFTARSLVVLAARAADLQPIDTVYADVKNEAGLQKSISEAKTLGFVGKGCIHPSQVKPVEEGFMPSEAQIEKARKIVAAMKEAEAKGLGAIALGSKMIDPPVARQAMAVLKLIGE
ncbi:MAG: HpcH/HpaI aldolase/citrate lyase family protein [Candidatus Sabulitectum sp.]|nr:HpcH/HpaI aldolase/citrate lyase family protein [Candidatus Sabulitectum sp.]